MRETKVAPQFIKSINGRAVTGLYSVYGNVDSYADVAQPGMMAKTIAERGSQIFHLWQHDFGSPAIAVVKDLRELRQDELPDAVKAEYPEATGGAEVTREYLDTERGNEILQGLNAGVPYKMSFAYDPVKFDLGEQDGIKVRYLREIRLYETSDVLWGANDATVASKRAPSTKTITTALRSLKMGGSDLWEAMDECYDLAGGASAFSSVAYLLSGECDDPTAAAPLINVLRLLLGFLGGEIDKVEAQIAAGNAGDIQMAGLWGIGQQLKALQKSGARHSTADMTYINAIHQAAVDLGATQCKGIVEDTTKADVPADVESRAEQVSLTLTKARIFLLDYTH